MTGIFGSAHCGSGCLCHSAGVLPDLMDPKAGAARRGDGRLQLSLQVLWDAMAEWDLGIGACNNVGPMYFAMYME